MGYALTSWDGLLVAAAAAGHQVAYLERVGLLVSRDEHQRYDRFRGRVMFPIHNGSGRVVGFGGRTLKKDASIPKYLNSPESDIYHKSDVLYGLFQARQTIRQQQRCYLVEGYLDVLSLHQGGIKNVVSSSGTSLTKGQVRLLRRYSDNVTVLYDGDPAGIKASLRGIDQLLEGGLNVRVVLLPADHDPDSYIRAVGDAEFTTYIEQQAQDFISFKTGLVAREAGGDPVKKAEAIREVLHSITLVPDALKRQVFLQQTGRAFQMPEHLIESEYSKLVGQGRPADPAEGEEQAAPLSVRQQCEMEVLRLLVLYGAHEAFPGVLVAQFLVEQLGDVSLHTPLYVKLWEQYSAGYAAGRPPLLRELALTTDTEVRALLADFATTRYDLSPNWRIKDIYVPTELALVTAACTNAVLRLTKCHVQQQRQDCMAVMNDESRGGEAQMAALQQFQTLTQRDNQLAKQLGIVVSRPA